MFEVKARTLPPLNIPDGAFEERPESNEETKSSLPRLQFQSESNEFDHFLQHSLDKLDIDKRKILFSSKESDASHDIDQTNSEHNQYAHSSYKSKGKAHLLIPTDATIDINSRSMAYQQPSDGYKKHSQNIKEQKDSNLLWAQSSEYDDEDYYNTFQSRDNYNNDADRDLKSQVSDANDVTKVSQNEVSLNSESIEDVKRSEYSRSAASNIPVSAVDLEHPQTIYSHSEENMESAITESNLDTSETSESYSEELAFAKQSEEYTDSNHIITTSYSLSIHTDICYIVLMYYFL